MKLNDYREELRQDAEYLAAEAELRPLLDLADDVLTLRLAQNWSQADLAERVGTRQANISRLESGLANPTVRFLQKLAESVDAELVVQLRPRQGPPRVETRAAAVTCPAESSTEQYIAVPNWPRLPAPCSTVWDYHTSASTVQQEASA